MTVELRKIAVELIPAPGSDVFAPFASASASIYVPRDDSPRQVSEVIGLLGVDGWLEVRRFVDEDVTLDPNSTDEERAIVSQVQAAGAACNVRRVRRIMSAPVDVTAQRFRVYKKRVEQNALVWRCPNGEFLAIDIDGETAVPILANTLLEDTPWRQHAARAELRHLNTQGLATFLRSELMAAERLIVIDLEVGTLTTFHPGSLLQPDCPE